MYVYGYQNRCPYFLCSNLSKKQKYFKRWVYYQVIQITQPEAEQVQRLNKKNRLKIASERKRHGGKTYYVLNDDYGSLDIVAKMRGIKRKDLFR